MLKEIKEQKQENLTLKTELKLQHKVNNKQW